MHLRAFFTAVALLLGLGAGPAAAVPLLQLYIEGAVYDQSLEGWLADGQSTVRLWAIGNVAGPGGKGTISNVRVAVAYDATPGVGIQLVESTTGGYGGFFDPSTSNPATFLQTVTDGSIPLLSGGASLPSHGIYHQGVYWQEFLLGDFSLTDAPIADFITSFPDAPADGSGQINVYEIVATGAHVFHFDLYDSIQAGNKARAVFAPFSHDADTHGSDPCCQLPEPAPLALLALGLGAMILVRSRVA